MKWMFLTVLLLCCVSAEAKVPGFRMTQLDVARQIETCSFISNYVDRVSVVGYDVLLLYLEARVATKTFALPADECYTSDEMRGIVAHAAENGMMVIPVVSLLGHAEQFFSHPGFERYMERGGENIRSGSPSNTMTFCLSNPGTREFLANYVADLCEIFPAPYFHVGFDEAWNSGTCPVCHEMELEDKCFTQAIVFAHDLLRKHGKRMWMWDDFFGFHPKALSETPRDVVLFHWNYDTDISDRGDRFNFSGRLREDSLAKLISMGFDVVPCVWTIPDNVRTFVDYARHHRVYGFLQTQWENKDRFQGLNFPHVVAASFALDDPSGAHAEDPYVRAVAVLFPSLKSHERAAVVRLLEKPDDALALKVLNESAFVRDGRGINPDQLSERAMLDDILCHAKVTALEGACKRAALYARDPRRTSEDIAVVRKILGPVISEARCLARRRTSQAKMWRPSCHPQVADARPMKVADEAEMLLRQLSPVEKDEKVLELELTLVDRYGDPRWMVEGCFDGKWKEIASGSWKPEPGHATYVSRQYFRSDSMPLKIRIGYSGYGMASLRYASIVDRDSRSIPVSVLGTVGLVRNAPAVLKDDYEAVEFGEFDFMPAYYDRRRLKFRSSLTIALREEVWK